MRPLEAQSVIPRSPFVVAATMGLTVHNVTSPAASGGPFGGWRDRDRPFKIVEKA
jgi:hypothetical protein